MKITGLEPEQRDYKWADLDTFHAVFMEPSRTIWFQDVNVKNAWVVLSSTGFYSKGDRPSIRGRLCKAEEIKLDWVQQQ